MGCHSTNFSRSGLDFGRHLSISIRILRLNVSLSGPVTRAVGRLLARVGLLRILSTKLTSRLLIWFVVVQTAFFSNGSRQGNGDQVREPLTPMLCEFINIRSASERMSNEARPLVSVHPVSKETWRLVGVVTAINLNGKGYLALP